jgi:ferredoxin
MIEYGALPRIESGIVRIETNTATINSNRAYIENAVPKRCGLGGNCGTCKFRKHCANH